MEDVDEVEARKRAMVAEARRRAQWPSRALIGTAVLWALGAVGLYAMAKLQGSQLMALVAIGLLGPGALVGLGGWLLGQLRGWMSCGRACSWGRPCGYSPWLSPCWSRSAAFRGSAPTWRSWAWR